MKLINQNDYQNVIYITKTEKSEEERTSGLLTTVKSSGCGICTGMMVAEFFGREMSIEDAIQLAYDYKANTGNGTKYKEYSRGLCDLLDLTVERTDAKEKLFDCLDSGGCAVVNVGGDHDNHLGIFSHIGHYIFVYKRVGDNVYILDPGYTPDKYLEEDRIARVKVEDDCLISNVSNLLEDIENRESPIFLYTKRKKTISYQSIFERIDKLKNEYLTYWKDIVEIDSPTEYKEGVDRVGKYLIDKAARQLWDIEIEENEIVGNAICITMNPGGTLQPIAISAHMDTVHPIGSMNTYIKDEKIYGPGCTDCKGGLIICLLVMKALKDEGYIDRPIRFILQADEENGSRLSNHKTIDYMIEKAKDCCAFFNLECYRDGTIVTSRKGIRRYELTVHGKAAHSSVCNQGISSVLEMSHKIIELEKLKQPDDITINVGTIEGGTTTNTVPETCKISIDVRFNDEKQMNEADNYIRNIVNTSYVPGTNASLKLISTRIAMEHKEENTILLNKINDVFSMSGLSLLSERKAAGGSDAAYTSNANIPTIDSIGVSGGYIHSKDEYANISSLADNAKRVAAIIYGLK